MIRKFEDFIIESKYEDFEKKYHSIGEWIESQVEKDDYLKSIVANFIGKFDTDIRISNAVNLLEEFDKKQLFFRIYNYLNRGEREKSKDSTVMTNIVFESNENIGGINIFGSFLKSLTALGQKNILNQSSPNHDFLFFYKTDELDVNKIKSVFGRFQSLVLFTDLIEYTNNNVSLFYGLDLDMMFQYGLYTDKPVLIGEFKLTRTNYNSLVLNQSPSANSLKRDIIGLDIEKLSLMCKISKEMNQYDLPAQSEIGPTIKGDIMTYAYYGVGKWDNGVLDEGEVENIKSNFKNWLMKFRWSNKILVNISSNSFWVYLNIKIK